MRSRSDVLVPASAVAFGLLTWSVAHVLTYALFAHSHVEPNAFAHVPEGAGPPVVAVAAFVLTSIAAATAGAQRSPRAELAGRMQPGSVTAVVAPAAFIAVESCEYLVRGGEAPPGALLLIGIVVHTALGAVTPWMWSGLVRHTVRALLIAAAWCPARSTRARSALVVDPDRPATPPLSPAAGRGPPDRNRYARFLSSYA
jgi:hypothetical protein